MKTFFMKIFLIIASSLCLFEGLVLVAVGLGQLSSERLLLFYNSLLAAPKSLTTILAIGVFFVILGFILLIVSSRTRPAAKIIIVEKDGKTLRIPQDTVKSFIKQILEQNPYASDISVDFEAKDEWTDIRIAFAFNAVGSAHQEVNRIEEVLKNEVENVFDWKDFKFIFQLRGVGIDSQKKYFPSAKGKEQQIGPKDKDIGAVEITKDMLSEEDLPKEESQPKNKNKGKDKNKNIISKILWPK